MSSVQDMSSSLAESGTTKPSSTKHSSTQQSSSDHGATTKRVTTRIPGTSAPYGGQRVTQQIMNPKIVTALKIFFEITTSYKEMIYTVIPVEHWTNLFVESMEDIAKKQLDGIQDNNFRQLDCCYNIAALFMIYNSWNFLPFYFLSFLVTGICVTKEVFHVRRRKIIKVKPKFKDDTAYEEKFFENIMRTTLSCDPVADIFIEDKKLGMNWINDMIQILWLNFRPGIRHYILQSWWPHLKRHGHNPYTHGLNIHDFHLGNQPIRIDRITCEGMESKNEIIVDVELAYDGNACLTLSLVNDKIDLPRPTTIEHFTMSNVKARFIFKNLIPHLPLISGIQILFLECPTFGWQPAQGVLYAQQEFKEMEDFLVTVIEAHFIRRLVFPCRLSYHLQVPNISWTGIDVKQVDETSLSMPLPFGLLHITVIRATDLKPPGLKNPFQNVLKSTIQRKAPMTTYVSISIANRRFKSKPFERSNSPRWDYVCEFPLEYYQGQSVHFTVYSEELVCGRRVHEFLGSASEKLDKIYERKFIEDWYNLELLTGRIFVRFQWVPLATYNPAIPDIQPGTHLVFCLLVGTFRSSFRCRPTVFLEMNLGKIKDDSGHERIRADRRVTHSALNLGKKWSFNEGQVFRVRKNFSHSDAFLEIRIWDDESREWLGMRRFYLADLIAKPLFDGPLRFGTMNSFRPACSLNFNTKILCDKGNIREVEDVDTRASTTLHGSSSDSIKLMDY